jgi:cellulose synthase/poly-beta-1,6-N-acetylglucosamine synthase-like glycosyltransferase
MTDILNKACVIIPAKGKPEKLQECIKSILTLDYPNLEIIVVDDGLEEAGIKILDNFKGKIKILKSNSCGPSYARNLAALNSDAEFIAFTDSDCIVDKDWLRELTRGFREYPQAVSCGGIQRVSQEATAFEKKAYLFMRRCGIITDYARTVKGEDIIEVGHNPSCNVMYKRQVYLKEGGFLEGLWPGEDVEFDYRLKKQGYALCFNPRAIVYHHKPDTPRKFVRMMFRYGFAQGLLVRRYGFFRRVHAAGIFFAFMLLLLLLSAFLNRALFIFYALAGVILAWLYRFNFSLPAFFLWGALAWESGFIKGLVNKGDFFRDAHKDTKAG